MKKIMMCLSVSILIIFTGTLVMADERRTKTIKENDCTPWEERNADNKCVDQEGVTRHEKGFVPPTHLRCFVECGCATDQEPKAYPKCAPCGYISTVCIPR